MDRLFPSTTGIATLASRHSRMHAAQHVLELFNQGESFLPFLSHLDPAMRRSVEGLLLAAAESWSNACTELELAEKQGEDRWLY